MKKTLSLLLVLLLLISCGSSRKMRHIRRQALSASLALSHGEQEEERRTIRMGKRDTLTVKDDEGNDIIIMKAVRDEETGEMVATDVIDAAVITARFRNIAERLGQIDIRFDIRVPASMQDSKWQLRLYPHLYVMADSLQLPGVILTGTDYRKEQLRGYQLYERYLRSIITDSTRFVDWRNLNIWIERNLAHKPEFGPDEQEALLHYTRKMLKRYHQRKWAERDKVFSQYVRAPFLEGIRLDTVIRQADGDFLYEYTQTIRTRPKLKKVEVVLTGDIFQEDQRLYTMPQTEPVSFYVSSLSDLSDGAERYVTRVVERRATSHTACRLAFRSGKADIDLRLEDNSIQMARIRDQILEIEQSDRFETDSVVIRAWASPEGSVEANRSLSRRRAQAVADHFRQTLAHYRDSADRGSFAIRVAEGSEEVTAMEKRADIHFLWRGEGENWPLLGALVKADTVLTDGDKAAYGQLSALPLTQRKQVLRKSPYYRHVRETLYPQLRVVSFDFFLSRKGMVKDTIHTTEPDTLYRRGVQYLRERDYPAALEILRPYRDFNTALAYLALDANASALDILERLERTPQVNYLLALLYARRQDDAAAVQCFLDACREDRSLLFRGNLDPEIHVLIERYGLNREDDSF